MGKLQDLFKSILDGYNSSSRPKSVSKNSPIFVSFKEIINILEDTEWLKSHSEVIVKLNIGMGNWSKNPAVAITDRPPKKAGSIYVIVIFCEDMSGFYLSLAHGANTLFKELGDEDASLKLSSLVSESQQIIHSKLNDLGLSNQVQMNLNPGGVERSNYNLGCIANKFYSASNVPSDEDFFRDLEQFLNLKHELDGGRMKQGSAVLPRFWGGTIEASSFFSENAKEVRRLQSWRKHRIFSWGEAKQHFAELIKDVRPGDYFAVLGYTGTQPMANHYCSGSVISVDPAGILQIEIWEPELRGYVDLVTSPTGKRFFEVVDEAARANIFGENFPVKQPKYWAGGHVWGGVPQKDRFIADKIWEHGFKTEHDLKQAKETFDNFSQIKVNDYIVIKGLGGKNDLVIYAVGRVTAIHSDKNQVQYEPLDIPLYKGKAPKMERSWFTTLTDVVGSVAINAIFGGEAMTPKVQIEVAMSMNNSQHPLNQILYGPPGTGKTYDTVNRAVSIIDPVFYGNNQNDRDAILKRFNELKEQQLIGFVTFHQSFSYEEFVEGFKADKDENDQLVYRVEPGVFKTMCEDATGLGTKTRGFTVGEKISAYTVEKVGVELLSLIKPNGSSLPFSWDMLEKLADLVEAGEISIDDIKGKRVFEKANVNLEKHIVNGYENILAPIVEKIVGHRGAKSTNESPRVLIIDEINRGNIAKIFGELITLIEENKRFGKGEGLSVTLPYSKQPFSVPDNLFIIGTMNTADRSLTSIDMALRRRFKFVEITPNSDHLEKVTNTQGINVKKIMEEMNNRIELLLGKEYLIGHSYFLSLGKNPSLDKIGDLFRGEIIPLLKEYFFDDWGKIHRVLGDHQKPDNAKIVRNRFNDSEVTALLGEDWSGSKENCWAISEEALQNPEAFIGIYQAIK